jgi:two-component system, LytTR family, sensor kinase
MIRSDEVNWFRYLRNIVYYMLLFYSLLHLIFFRFLPDNVPKTIIFGFTLLIGFSMIRIGIEHYLFHTDIISSSNVYLTANSFNAFVGRTLYDTFDAVIYSLAYWHYWRTVWLQKQQLATEQKLTKTRISFLKAQINPHFLYNTLNFFYSEAAATNPNVARSILLLSDIMRYTVSSSSEEKVSLAKETEMIEKYLEIQRIRFGDNLHAKLHIEGFLAFRLIPPLILLTFVENAFKYGKLNDPDNPLEIRLSVNSNGLDFFCSNLKNTNFKDRESTGVGIENIKQRLEIIYHSDFHLAIENKVDFYTVSLNINF